jgi:hypothetical protein
MKVRVAYTVDVGDDYRRAINHYYGRAGLATRSEVRDWLTVHGSANDDDLMSELDAADENARAAQAGKEVQP